MEEAEQLAAAQAPAADVEGPCVQQAQQEQQRQPEEERVQPVPTASNHCAANTASGSRDGSVRQLKGGASELKQVLHGARQLGQRVVLVWLCDGRYGADAGGLSAAVAELAADADSRGGTGGYLVLLEADTRTPANRVLAAGLKVGRTPVVHIYCGMAVEACLVQPNGQQLRGALSSQQGQQGRANVCDSRGTGSQSPPACEAAAGAHAGAKTPSGPGSSVDGDCAPGSGSGGSDAAAGTVGSTGGLPPLASRQAAAVVDYDPPPKAGKPATARRFPEGRGAQGDAR